MQNSKAFDHEIESQLTGIGGEPLAGSGFEDELPEPEFAVDPSGEE